MSSSRTGRSIAAASFAFAVALAACSGHLDFGLGSRDAGAGGTAARDAGADALGGRGTSGAGGAGGAGGGSSVARCAADGDCRVANLHCDLAGDRTCVECVADDHCSSGGGAAGGPRCDTKARRCVACLTAAQCPSAQTCVAGRCISTCVEDSVPSTCAAGTKCESGLCAACEPDNANPCGGTPATPFCLASPQICVACRGDSDCAGGTRCDPVRKACVACVVAADCPATKPLCDLSTGTCF